MKASPPLRPRKGIIQLFASLAVLICSPVVGQDLPQGKWWQRPILEGEIGLTVQQSREIERVFLRSRPSLIDLGADLEKQEVVLQSLLEEYAPSREALERRIDGVEAARAKLRKARTLMIQEMKHFLRPEQWQRLLQVQQEVRERKAMSDEGHADEYSPPVPVRPTPRQTQR